MKLVSCIVNKIKFDWSGLYGDLFQNLTCIPSVCTMISEQLYAKRVQPNKAMILRRPTTTKYHADDQHRLTYPAALMHSEYHRQITPHLRYRTLAWMSDIHLNFLDEYGLRSFLSELSSYQVDGWLISGDIGTSSNVINFLDLLADTLDQPIYFVLGNHDFYGSSLSKTADAVKKFVENKPRLIWLTWSEIQNLGTGIALVGDDGWGDARLGHAYETSTMLNDFFHIQELCGLSRKNLVEKLNQLGDESVLRIKPKLIAAAENNNKVIVVTHVPPFGEAARNERQSDKDDYLPWYSCKVMGDLLLDCANDFPDVDFLVVCGHTHGACEYHPRSNLEVLTAGAYYYVPRVDRILEV